MRYKRTPLNQRNVYKQYDDDGNIVSEFDPETDNLSEDDEKRGISVQEKREIVRQLHLMDDSEVKRNNKERKLDPFSQQQYDEMKACFIKKFREENGRNPYPDEMPEGGHRSFVYLEASCSKGDDEKNSNTNIDSLPIAKAMSVNPFSMEVSLVDIMDEIIQTEEYDDVERDVYFCKIHRGLSNKDTGECIGTSGQYAGRIWKKMQEKIRKNNRIRKFFRF